MNLDTLKLTIDALSPEERQELRQYLDQVEAQPKPVKKQRILGMHAHLGNFWMSDDFDDELPDEFWGFDRDL